MENRTDDYKGVWILAETREEQIHPVSFELLAWGRDLADKLDVELTGMIIGYKIKDMASELIHGGADKVYVVDNPSLKYFRADPYSRILVSFVREHKPEILLASATSTGRTIMPMCAAELRTGLTSDCTGLDIDLGERLLVQTRRAFGGKMVATIKIPLSRPQMATVRPKSKRPLSLDRSRNGEIIVKELGDEYFESRVNRIDFIKEDTVGIPIQDADIIVSCGKGIKDAKNLKLINELARLLGGSVGASRKVVDQRWLSYSHQVGLSGKTVSPDLYIACGISGAIQHLAGMSSAQTVIAINSDPDANIFKMADFSVVGDLFRIIPLFIHKLKEMGKE